MQESAYNLFSLQTVSYVVLLEVFIAIHTKYVSLGKLNKSLLMVELRSALGQYLSLAGHMLCFDFLPLTYFSLFFPSCYFLVLRKFESWNPSSNVKSGQPEYYQKQVYDHGTRCWNGPERNVIVSAPIPWHLPFLLYLNCYSLMRIVTTPS